MFTLSTDISGLIERLFNMFFSFLGSYINALDSVIILHRDGFEITVFDLLLGVLVVSIVLGAFLHISRPDDYYANK